MLVRIASWNVNSLKVRLPQVLEWLEQYKPDVLALQETKTPDAAFPEAAFRREGWCLAYSGQKTYNGVALISRSEPSELVTDLPDRADTNRRLLGATIGGVRVYTVYVPNGKAVGTDAYAYKLDWLERARGLFADELAQGHEMVVLGDFNIAPGDADVYDPEALYGTIHCSDAERDRLQRIQALGLSDTFRAFEQPPATFTWWDYRANAFRRNRGLRIDLALASPALHARLEAAGVDPAPRRHTRPSDHAPIFARFA